MRPLRTGGSVLLAAALALPATAVVVAATARPAVAGVCGVRTPGDVDGDGRSDVVLGQPTRAVGPADGAVSVIRGGPGGGLTTTGGQFITDATLGLGPVSNTENFGLVAVTGFFDADCYADAVIGVTDYTNPANGAIVTVRGGPAGLDVTTAHRYTATQLAGGASEFGTSLAAGDFNHDGYDDVAVGAYGTSGSSGGVGVLYGSALGLTLAGRQWFTQDTNGVPGTATANYEFGRSVAAADFDQDGYADLAVGVPGADVTRSVGAGAVIVLRGSATGLTGTGSTEFDEDLQGVPGTAEDGDKFGFAVATGDVTADGHPDLVVGVLSEVDAGAFGAVFLLKGSPSGITPVGAQFRDQSSAGFPASPTLYGYGSTLAVADYNGDGFADIASGAGATVVNGHNGAGAFAVLYGTATGLSTAGSAIFTEDTAGMPGIAESGDQLGIGMRALPVTPTGYAGLIVPAPGESSSGATDNGGIEVVKGGPSGITTTDARYLDGADLAGGLADNAQLGYDQPLDPCIC